MKKIKAVMKSCLFSLAILSLSSMSACAGPQTPGSILRPWNESDYPAKYSAKEIRARIVDADTGTPIEGAVVVAKWVLTGGMSPLINLEVLEAVTDKDGWVHISGWGPKRRPALRYLENRDPELLIFKTGYKYLGLYNMSKEYLSKYVKDRKLNLEELDSDKLLSIIQGESALERIPVGAIRESVWSERTIKLHKPLDEKEYWTFLGWFQSDIKWGDEETNWKAIKNAVREVEKNRNALPKKFEWYLSPLPDDAKKIIYEEGKP